MSFLIVKNMKAILLNVLMTLEAFKKEASETPLLVDGKNGIAVSPMTIPFKAAKIEVRVKFLSTD